MIDRVTALLREVAAKAVMPRWRQLQPHEIAEKEKGDLVTAADREAEDLLTVALRDIKPGSAVIGEEAAAANPAILSDFGALPSLWLVDPVDGTSNFIRGSDRFALMVAYLERGVVRASWIYLPTQDKFAVAEAGSGAWINGRRVKAPEPPAEIAAMTGAAHVNRLPEPLRAQVKSHLKRFHDNQPAFCAGYDYVALLEGSRHFSLYNRTLPWDHAPGTFLLAEAGGKSARFDGSAFIPDELDEYGKGRGLLSAPTRESWQRIRDALFTDAAG
ncbi:MAG TPA: inositol monophosphatase family protein [Sphingomonadales bacterium]